MIVKGNVRYPNQPNNNFQSSNMSHSTALTYDIHLQSKQFQKLVPHRPGVPYMLICVWPLASPALYHKPFFNCLVHLLSMPATAD